MYTLIMYLPLKIFHFKISCPQLFNCPKETSRRDHPQHPFKKTRDFLTDRYFTLDSAPKVYIVRYKIIARKVKVIDKKRIYY